MPVTTLCRHLPAIQRAGWDIQRQVREEVTFTLRDQLNARLAAARAKHAQLTEAPRWPTP